MSNGNFSKFRQIIVTSFETIDSSSHSIISNHYLYLAGLCHCPASFVSDACIICPGRSTNFRPKSQSSNYKPLDG